MAGIDFHIFRDNLRKARFIKELTANELSKAAGLRQVKRISDIEEGRGKPSLDEVHSICVALDQDVSDMLYREGKIVIEFK